MPLLITKCNYSWTDGKTVITHHPRHILKSYSNVHFYTSFLHAFQWIILKMAEGCDEHVMADLMAVAFINFM